MYVNAYEFKQCIIKESKMKKVFLMLSLALVTISCSNEDETTTIPPSNVNPVQKTMDKEIIGGWKLKSTKSTKSDGTSAITTLEGKEFSILFKENKSLSFSGDLLVNTPDISTFKKKEDWASAYVNFTFISLLKKENKTWNYDNSALKIGENRSVTSDDLYDGKIAISYSIENDQELLSKLKEEITMQKTAISEVANDKISLEDKADIDAVFSKALNNLDQAKEVFFVLEK